MADASKHIENAGRVARGMEPVEHSGDASKLAAVLTTPYKAFISGVDRLYQVTDHMRNSIEQLTTRATLIRLDTQQHEPASRVVNLSDLLKNAKERAADNLLNNTLTEGSNRVIEKAPAR